MKNLLGVILLCIVSVSASFAQCAMCGQVAEQNGSTSMTEGINGGILWLMAFPYIIIGIGAFFIWKAFKRKKLNSENS